MFGPIGGFELLVLAVIGLLVFGPRRLPEIGRTLGRIMVEFRRAATELRTSIEREIDLEEVKETTRSIKKTVEEELLQGPVPRRRPQEPQRPREESKGGHGPGDGEAQD